MSTVNLLSSLGMDTGKGLVFVSEPKGDINYSELLALKEAEKFGANAVYFRRVENENRSVPQVYIYTKHVENKELVDIHTKLWSSGIVPFFYIITDTEVKIFNCTKSADKIKESICSTPLHALTLSNNIQQQLNALKFSAELFDNGVFWEEHPDILDVSNSPYQKLLEGLLGAKEYLKSQYKTVAESIVNKLLVIGILIRYLEEKEDAEGRAIRHGLYDKFNGCDKFTDILRAKQIVPFLGELNQKFNGKLFDLQADEKQIIAELELGYVADIFDARIDARTKQYILWEIYSFNHLPIELISGIYEAFLSKKEKDSGIVYTPPYLVNALIDECMPLDKAEEFFKESNYKVLDPACGSGIFLVAALKRMVQWWAILQYKETGVIAYPSIDVVKSFARNNIYGIDIEHGATLITIFSICIAICDKLSPMQIWNELRFDDLSKSNIIADDFFKVYSTYGNDFDLVIGNPPFNHSPTVYTNKSFLQYAKENYLVKPSHRLNDDNLALFFWDRAVHLRKKNGKICLILPAGAWLYNKNSFEYRKHFLDRFQVDKIIDFTHLSDKLFHGSTDVAVCAAIATDLPEEKPRDIVHIVVRRSKVAEERFYFEIDHYDFHNVSYNIAKKNSYVWKANLLGGGRLIRLLNYLGALQNLEQFLVKKRREDNWEFGEGYIVGHDGSIREERVVVSKSGRRRTYIKAAWITNRPAVVTETFEENSIPTIYTENEIIFEWPRTKTQRIFQPPHILIKENLGKNHIPMLISTQYLCFKHEIIGIHAPQDQIEELKQLYQNLQARSRTYRLFLLASSTRAGITRSTSTLIKNDIMSLPYPEESEDLQLSYSEAIVQNDVLEYYINSKTHSVNSILNKPVASKELQEFGEVFCNILNPIYEKNGQKWFARGFYTQEDNAIVYAFCYGKPLPDILPNLFDGGLQGIEGLLQNSNLRNIRIYRVLRQYLHLEGYDVLLLIKPKSMRYWLKSIALRDADETFADLKRTGF